jgi:hypothetical protein
MDSGDLSMQPNFEQMSVPDLRAYVLSHRDDIEAIRALFNHPDLESRWVTMPPMFTPDGEPIEENIRLGEEALKQRIERERRNKK